METTHSARLSAPPAQPAFESLLHDQSQAQERTVRVGSGFVNHMWYYALPAERLKKGTTIAKVMLGQPLLLGRDLNGKPFALRDICPHQAVPLSCGRFDGRTVECCYHGWKFDTSGTCTEIPSLCNDQKINLCHIQTGSYPCREVQGSLWVYCGDNPDNPPEVPVAPGLEGYRYDKTTTTLVLPTHIDYAAIALIDTAHVPYVHKAWWWRSARRVYEKAKRYVPSGTGWTMVRHRPSKNAAILRLLNEYLETEISFRLPGCRREYITFGGRTLLSGISTLTPIDDENTELNHTTYWTIPGIKPLVKPFIDYFVRAFLTQDKDISEMQRACLKYGPTNLIMTIKDAGTPGNWYLQLKREWNDAHADGRPFVNPVKEKVLRWRT